MTALKPTARPETLRLTDSDVELLDQTVLPHIVRVSHITTASEMVDAIRNMFVRGAPAIGIAGAYGMVLSARSVCKNTELPEEQIRAQLQQDAQQLRNARPTAVNLMWAIDAILPLIDTTPVSELISVITQKALAIHEDDRQSCLAIGRYGAELIQAGSGVLTHCNAGVLATGGIGTAIGVIRTAYARDLQNKTAPIQIYADETRPRLQGAKLTVWELTQDHIPVTLICEGMAATLMKDGKVQAVVTGADRIAANGDSANKIGTYPLAIVAQAHQVPFYIAAPFSTIDLTLSSGNDIPIEERPHEEVHTVEMSDGDGVRQVHIAPQDSPVLSFYNPSFDVTPARYITAIITDRGVARPDARTGDFTASLRSLSL